MSIINKDKFLAELGKLLTFMYEEDRITALEMYENMFGEVNDEEALLNALVSPTRQAVMIARSYDAKERKLAVHATEGQDRAGVSGDEPARFITCINDIFDEALDLQPAVEVLKDQISLFGDDGELAETAVVPEAVPETEYVPEISLPDVDAFIKDFTIVNDELENGVIAQEPEPEIKPEEAPAPAPAAEAEVTDFTEVPEEPVEEPAPVRVAEPKKAKKKETAASENTKISGGKLGLFLLIAIPLTALGIIAILILAALFLGVAAGLLYLGFNTIKAAFASFVVFADVLVVLGIGLIITALGALALWIFIWLLFGGMKGLVNGVINLATRICSKESAKA